MIRIALLLITSLMLTTTVMSQDKAAKKHLDKVSDKYATYDNMTLDISMVLTLPEEAPQTSEIEIVQEGLKYKILHPQQEIYCDGNDIWMYIADQNEVQINDFDPEMEVEYMITPKDLLNQYNSGKYSYQISDKKQDQVQIEFLPNDRDSDYSKYRINIDTRNNDILQMWAFGKDGSLIALEIKNQEVNQKLRADTFTFDISKHPNIRIEDLRLD